MARPRKRPEEEPEWEDLDSMPRTMEIGEVLEGTFVGTRPGKFGDVFMLDSPEGERYNIYGGHQFESVLTPDKVGRTFRIKHVSIEDTSRGFKVRTYKIQIKREKSV